MKRHKTAALALALTALSCHSLSSQPPSVQIGNKQLHLKIYLPDAQNGFYTGTRFDWSGAITDLEFAGHHLYQPWFVGKDASVRDFAYKDEGIVAAPNSAMTGPAEEFQTPIAYDTTKVGDPFLKLGVGFLRKADDASYAFSKHFDLVDGGKWTTKSDSKSVTAEQVLGAKGSAYAYIYTKTIRLVGDDAKLVIEHHLKNTGRQTLSTKLYDHNFLTVDELPVSAGYTIKVPYTIQPIRQPDAKFVTISGSTARYVTSLQGQDRVAFGLQGFSSDVADYHFEITNAAAHVKITIDGDRPLSNVAVWSVRDVIAVEPFIDIEVAPGQETSWSYTYVYSTAQD